MLPRRLDLAADLRHRSVFLFGPRQTGKTTWLRRLFPFVSAEVPDWDLPRAVDVGGIPSIYLSADPIVTGRDLRGLRRLAEETPLAHRIVVCGESAARVVDGIRILPVRDFLGALWRGELLGG